MKAITEQILGRYYPFVVGPERLHADMARACHDWVARADVSAVSWVTFKVLTAIGLPDFLPGAGEPNLDLSERLVFDRSELATYQCMCEVEAEISDKNAELTVCKEEDQRYETAWTTIERLGYAQAIKLIIAIKLCTDGIEERRDFEVRTDNMYRRMRTRDMREWS